MVGSDADQPAGMVTSTLVPPEGAVGDHHPSAVTARGAVDDSQTLRPALGSWEDQVVPLNDRPPRSRSPLRVGLGVVYVLLALAGSLLLAIFAVFAVSPTVCPDVGGSYLCRNGAGGLVTLGGIGVLLMLCIGLAIGVPVSRTATRAWLAFGGSALSAVLAAAVGIYAASTWS